MGPAARPPPAQPRPPRTWPGCGASGDRLDLHEVEQVYLPLSRLLNFYVGATAGLHRVTTDFLRRAARAHPLRHRRGRVGGGRQVHDLPDPARAAGPLARHAPGRAVTTDGFLYPNAELERRGLLQRKGFPESYDRRALLRFVAEVKAGADRGQRPGLLPPDLRHRARRAGGRAPPRRAHRRGPERAAAAAGAARRARPGWPSATSSTSRSTSTPGSRTSGAWYVDRFLRLRETAFADPHSYFHRYAALSDDEARATAERIWATINEPNLTENVLPTRGRATLVMSKGEDHSVRRVRLRKL